MKPIKLKIRKLTRVSKFSYNLNIPKDFVNHLGWKERQKLNIKLNGKKLIISDWPGSGQKK